VVISGISRNLSQLGRIAENCFAGSGRLVWLANHFSHTQLIQQHAPIQRVRHMHNNAHNEYSRHDRLEQLT
jgi:serine/threonine protein phosphatase PrpC